MSIERPDTLTTGKDVYLRIDLAAKKIGKGQHCIYRYLRFDYAGMKMRHFKRGVLYIHEGDLKRFRALPLGGNGSNQNEKKARKTKKRARAAKGAKA